MQQNRAFRESLSFITPRITTARIKPIQRKTIKAEDSKKASGSCKLALAEEASEDGEFAYSLGATNVVVAQDVLAINSA